MVNPQSLFGFHSADPNTRASQAATADRAFIESSDTTVQERRLYPHGSEDTPSTTWTGTNEKIKRDAGGPNMYVKTIPTSRTLKESGDKKRGEEAQGDEDEAEAELGRLGEAGDLPRKPSRRDRSPGDDEDSTSGGPEAC